MTIEKRILGFVSIILFTGCSIVKQQSSGEVYPISFDERLDFTTAKSVIIIPVEVDGQIKNFLFDTGADLNLLQRDSIIGKTNKYQGASKRQMKLGKERVSSMKIGQVDFTNTIAVTGDLVGLKEQIPEFGGLIGQPIIKKANWFIDYPNKTIRFSKKNLVDSSFIPIRIKRKGGAPYTKLTINGEEHEVIIDMGSSSELNVPEGSKLAKMLLSKYKFDDNERERYTLGGLQTITEKVSVFMNNIDEVKQLLQLAGHS